MKENEDPTRAKYDKRIFTNSNEEEFVKEVSRIFDNKTSMNTNHLIHAQGTIAQRKKHDIIWNRTINKVSSNYELQQIII